MLSNLLTVAALCAVFHGADRAITKAGLNNPYYAVHAVHNAAIVAATASDVANTFRHIAAPGGLSAYTNNILAIQLCFALHIYHTIAYWRKFRFDDWLHHILMVAIALPIGCIYESRTLVGYSLFFTTGLPGGIDYACLFAVRNGWMGRLTEKKINEALNVWIRSPGCVSNAAFTVAYMCGMVGKVDGIITLLPLIPALLNYWNGQYFMGQVVRDRARLMAPANAHD